MSKRRGQVTTSGMRKDVVLLAAGAALSTFLYFVINPWIPFWSMAPVFQPGAAIADTPLDIPFSVHNPSTMAGISGLKIQCQLLQVITDHQNGTIDVALSASGRVGSDLRPFGTDFYTCPFTTMIKLPSADVLKAVKIRFRFTYYPAGQRGGTPTSGETAIFTGVGKPMRWMEGEGLK